MESKLVGVGTSKAVMAASLALLLCGLGASARADAIPYPTPGVVNPVVYTFTAGATGDVVAYFAGSSAGFTEELGLQVNGVSTGVFGLNNHSSALGESLILGHANAGDILTFVLRTISPDIGDTFSNPALNGTYDGGVGIQHVYSTPYTATSPIIDLIPVGTFVGWEDLPANRPGISHPDFDYNDLTFVFTNIAVHVPGPIAGAGLPGLILACGGLLALARRRRQIA
jgi:hypothetical protein